MFFSNIFYVGVIKAALGRPFYTNFSTTRASVFVRCKYTILWCDGSFSLSLGQQLARCGVHIYTLRRVFFFLSPSGNGQVVGKGCDLFAVDNPQPAAHNSSPLFFISSKMLMKLLPESCCWALSIVIAITPTFLFLTGQKGRGTHALIFLILISYPFGQISRFYITHK